MTTLYKKSEIWFSVMLIAVYIVGASIADELSGMIGVSKLITVPFLLVFSAVLLIWIKKNRLRKKYGICRVQMAASRFLYYIPLVIISTTNIWFGVKINMSFSETVLYILSMICVGFLEEMIFRGFLFRAMEKNGVRSAVIVSSLTFGIGHIVNLFNGSGMSLADNLCQIAGATSIGFLFVTLFRSGGSIIPCILSHAAINSLSAFSNEAVTDGAIDIATALFLCAVSLVYSLILYKTAVRNGK